MKTLKKVSLLKGDLQKNMDAIGEFLSQKNLSAIVGGGIYGYPNYCESTYVRK